ncbi:MAG: hypothetical protein ACJAWV_000778 [Flammeovirgaceae bacterium]|jgi:hypothetical protein
MRRISLMSFALMFFGMSFISAQEIDDSGYNYNSVRPIRRADIMYMKTLWRRMDLREKQNEPFFAAENEISKIVIDAVKAGVLRPFMNDSLTTRMSPSQFLENLKVPGGDEGLSKEDIEMGFGAGGDDAWGGGGGGGGGGDWGDSSGGGGAWGGDSGGGDGFGGDSGGGDGGTGKTVSAVAADEFFAKQIPILEIKEDLIFDRKRSRMYHDIQSITLVIPGEYYPSGIDKPLATFSYKELVENVFIDNPQAIWFNPKNTIENRNLADAFDLRLFDARIIKYTNPKDDMIEDVYNSDLKLSLGKSQQYEHDILEYESNMWSN